jgi:hypothetical protein
MPDHFTLKATTAKGRMELLHRAATNEANATRRGVSQEKANKKNKVSSVISMAQVLIQEEHKAKQPMPKDENADE